ncbi:MAG: hypothetical protein LBK13_04340 [Spirochaetales bacterium]|jgi:hypothetical protein|nr:hypothetical protein [Spirochaetales bacterium]
MVTDKLPSAAATQVILFVIAFFPVSGYAGALTMGALDCDGSSHDFIVFLCAPVVFTPFIILCRSPPNIELFGPDTLRAHCAPGGGGGGGE